MSELKPQAAGSASTADDDEHHGVDRQRRSELSFSWEQLPLITAAVPGTGGSIRSQPEDFEVDEVPAYEPAGHGSHLYLRIRKRGLTTRDLVSALAAAGVHESNIGVAGLKDKAAVTTQWLSIPKALAAASAGLEALPGVEVVERSFHRNKLGLGHLRGNRFVILVRDPLPGAAENAAAAFELLAALGAPNWFGPQRFGRFGSNAYDGWRVLRGETVPGGHRLRRFFVSALQSLVFNAILAERVSSGIYDSVVNGDWARKHETGGTFLVEDAALESPRAKSLELSATIPLYGRKVKPSPAAAGLLEAAIMERYQLQWQQFTSRRGDRRSTRIVVAEPSVSMTPEGLRLAFMLPKGSYATSVLREVMKVAVDEPLEPRPDGDRADQSNLE